MFPKTRHIETAFRHIRLFTAVTVAGSFCFCAYVTCTSYRMVREARNTLYVLASGKALQAVAGNRRENLAVEARDHIRQFHALFFTLDPDEKVINTNLSQALYLADASAKQMYDNLKENGYYAGLIAGNISQDLTVDSVVVDLQPYPYYFRCYSTERITRPTSVVTRNLTTEGWLRLVSRSDNNPHGFLIERWAILDNSDRKVEAR